MDRGYLRTRFLYNVIKGLHLPVDRLLLAGSASLYATGLLEGGGPRDLDVVVRDPATWGQVMRLGKAEKVQTKDFSGLRVKLDVDRDGLEEIDFTNSWPMAGRPLRRLFRDSMLLKGPQQTRLRYMSLRDVVVTKRVLGREKDLAHLDAVREGLEAGRPRDVRARISGRQGFRAHVPAMD